ncbi:very short patch repair endonuclease [Actinomadura luteofluorescens]|uniref:very short patch repair endonuclease n=1 Tax=Actinomadura luteofluorescens TaxID=46163 RepID=UPI00216426B4|nr:very short patch repair endonuclease [Actinomadura glauciflava]
MTEDSWASSPRARAVMRGNRSRDTKPEVQVRKILHANGLRFRVNMRPVASIRRTADIVFTRAKVAVFIDGCFWHGCPQHYVAAKTNVAYWENKIKKNRERDEETARALSEAGWTVLRFWSHENPDTTARIIKATVHTNLLKQR